MPSLPNPRRLLFAILLTSALLRLFSALYQGNTVEALPGIADQVSYHALTSRVLEGHGFSFGANWWPATRAGEPTAHWSYLYTLFLAAVYFLFGANPLAARILQALIVAVLQPWFSWRIGRRLFGEEAGLTAALVAAIYGYFIYYAGALVTESFYILAILWVLDLSTRLQWSLPGKLSGPRSAWIFLGIALGTAILLRQVFLLFLPFLFGWLFFVSRRNQGRRIVARGILTASLVAGIMIVPWTVRNYFAFGRFVLLNTNAGFAFFWGNHPIHGTDFVPILDGAQSYGSLLPARLRTLDEASVERELLREGIGFIRRDPQRYLLLSVSRAKEYFRFWPSAKSSGTSNVVRVASFGLFLPFMLTGIAAASFCSRGKRPRLIRNGDERCSGHLLLLLFMGVYTAIHLLSWTLIRYRLPVDSVLVLYAGCGIWWLASRCRPFGTPFENIHSHKACPSDKSREASCVESASGARKI